MAKAMDLLMWELHITGRDKVNPVIWKLADQVEERYGDRRCGRSARSDLEAEVGRFMEVYNAAWEKNWGFVPLTEREVRHYARRSSRSSTRTGPTSPRRTARRSARR